MKRQCLAVRGMLGLVVASLVRAGGGQKPDRFFKPFTSFDVIDDADGAVVAETIGVSPDARPLLYTDADNGAIGFVGTASPRQPAGGRCGRRPISPFRAQGPFLLACEIDGRELRQCSVVDVY